MSYLLARLAAVITFAFAASACVGSEVRVGAELVTTLTPDTVPWAAVLASPSTAAPADGPNDWPSAEPSDVDGAIECAYQGLAEGVTRADFSLAWEPIDGPADGLAPTPDGGLRAVRAGTYRVRCVVARLDLRDAEGALLTVLPPVPARVVLRAEPAREAYPAGAAVTLVWDVFNADGDLIEGLPATLTAPTEPAAVPITGGAPNRFRLGAEGRYPFTVRLDPPVAPLSDELVLIVDTTPPTITLTFPERGATLAATDAPVTVRGVVTDAVGVRALTINDEEATVAPDGTFAHPVASRWGLNNLSISAVDLAENTSFMSPAYQYSDRWTTFIDADARGLQQADSVRVLLGQRFFDDGAPSPDGQLDDLADLVALALTDLIDVRALVDQLLAGVALPPLPIADLALPLNLGLVTLDTRLSGDLVTTLGTADTTGTGPVAVRIDSRDGGLDLDLVVGTPAEPALAIDLVLTFTADLALTGQACSLLGCAPLPPGTATLTASTTLRLSMETLTVAVATDIAKSPGQPASVSVTRLETRLSPLRLAPLEPLTATLTIPNVPVLGTQVIPIPLSSFIDTASLTALVDGLIGPLSGTLLNTLPGLLNPLIQGVVGPLIEGVLGLLVLDTTLPIPSLSGGAPVDLDLSTGLSTIAFTDDGGTIALGTGLHTRRGVMRDPLGAIGRGDCLGASEADLSWGWDPSLALALSLDLGNSAIFALWWSGLLNGPIDLGGGGGGGIGLPVDGLSLTLDWLIPPILNDCDPDNGYVEIGDLAVSLSADALGAPISAELFADLRLSVSYETRPDGLYIVLGEVLESEFEVMALDDGALGDVLDLRSIIVDALPGLLGGFLSGQAIGPIALPPTDLSTILPTLPPGTTLGLGPLRATTQQGYLVVGSDLE